MTRLTPGKVNSLQRTIISWYRKHQRELQWRTTTDPYHILIAEVMLQQTQVSRVQEKLPTFLRSYPTLQHLASSSTAMIIQSWEGMGYNNRAIRLHEMAKRIIMDHNGVIPDNPEALMELPGIGPYSAHAVACFAFRKRVPVVDTNIRRVVTRLFRMTDTAYTSRSEKKIWRAAKEILPRDAYTWNQALMDLGAVICTSRRPLCHLCPVEKLCRSAHLHHSRKLDTRKTGKHEPSHDGIPRRI